MKVKFMKDEIWPDYEPTTDINDKWSEVQAEMTEEELFEYMNIRAQYLHWLAVIGQRTRE